MALDRVKVLEWAREDLLFFSNFFLPRRWKFQMAGIHRQMADHISKAIRGEIPNSMLIGPPGCSKSTLWRDGIVRECLFNRNLITLGVAEAMPEARNWTREVRRCFDEPRVVDYFGAVVDPRWDTAQGFALLGRTEWDDNANVSAVGMAGPLQRKHAHIILGDDCFVLKNQKNPNNRDYLVKWFTRILSRRTRIPGKGTHLVNNRLMRDDCTTRLEEGFFLGASLVISAEDDGGKSTCPQMWPDDAGLLGEDGKPLKTLAQLKEEMNRSGESDYEVMYLCQAVGEGDESIPPTAFLYYPDQVPLTEETLKKAKVRYGLDPGGTGDTKLTRSPWFGLVRVAYSQEHDIAYVMHALQKRCGLHEQEEIFLAQWREVPGLVTFERNNMGIAFKEVCQREAIPFRGPHVDDDHEFRTGRLKQWMQAGRIAFPGGKQGGAMKALLSQLQKAPFGHPHDLIDALYYAVEAAMTKAVHEGAPRVVRSRAPEVAVEASAPYFQSETYRQGPPTLPRWFRRAAWDDAFERDFAEPEHWKRILEESPY